MTHVRTAPYYPRAIMGTVTELIVSDDLDRRQLSRSRPRHRGNRACRRSARRAFTPRARPSRRTAGRASTRSSGSCAPAGLEPIVYIAAAPTWATTRIAGAVRPDPAAVPGLRARRRAALLGPRSAGSRASATGRPGTSRTRSPNRAAKVGAAGWYRALVNAFAASVHTVPGNLVIAGGLAPFGISTAVAPLAFMRDLLCVSDDPRRARPARRASTSTSGRRTRTPPAGRRTASPAPTTSRSLSCRR